MKLGFQSKILYFKWERRELNPRSTGIHAVCLLIGSGAWRATTTLRPQIKSSYRDNIYDE